MQAAAANALVGNPRNNGPEMLEAAEGNGEEPPAQLPFNSA
jgi:hypothetical protein